MSHQNLMETFFPRYGPYVRGIHRSPVNSPHKGQWRGALMFKLICAWTNGWVNNRKAGDLRRYRAHYDVIVMRLHWQVQHRLVFICWALLWARQTRHRHFICRHGNGRTLGWVLLYIYKPISSVPLFSEFFSIVKTHVRSRISHSYLTGVASNQL